MTTPVSRLLRLPHACCTTVQHAAQSLCADSVSAPRQLHHATWPAPSRLSEAEGSYIFGRTPAVGHTCGCSTSPPGGPAQTKYNRKFWTSVRYGDNVWHRMMPSAAGASRTKYQGLCLCMHAYGDAPAIELKSYALCCR